MFSRGPAGAVAVVLIALGAAMLMQAVSLVSSVYSFRRSARRGGYSIAGKIAGVRQ